MAALAAAAPGFQFGGRARQVLLVAALARALGQGWAWWRAETVAAEVLPQPIVTTSTSKAQLVEVQAAKDRYQVTMVPIGPPDLPPKLRVTIEMADAPPSPGEDDTLSQRARRVGPTSASIPGGADFSRTGWFQGVGATGKEMDKIQKTTVTLLDGFGSVMGDATTLNFGNPKRAISWSSRAQTHRRR
jgi:competence protein ComEC